MAFSWSNYHVMQTSYTAVVSIPRHLSSATTLTAHRRAADRGFFCLLQHRDGASWFYVHCYIPCLVIYIYVCCVYCVWDP